MPAVSRAQQMMMGAEMGRRASGMPASPGLMGMSLGQVRDYAATPQKGLPMKKAKGGKKVVKKPAPVKKKG